MNTTSRKLSSVGDTFRQLRQRANLSQEGLAEVSGLHRTYISQVERGVRNPSFNSIAAILDGCGATWSEFGAAVDRQLSSTKKPK